MLQHAVAGGWNVSVLTRIAARSTSSDITVEKGSNCRDIPHVCVPSEQGRCASPNPSFCLVAFCCTGRDPPKPARRQTSLQQPGKPVTRTATCAAGVRAHADRRTGGINTDESGSCSERRRGAFLGRRGWLPENRVTAGSGFHPPARSRASTPPPHRAWLLV